MATEGSPDVPFAPQGAGAVVDRIVRNGGDTGRGTPVARRVIITMAALGAAGIALGARFQRAAGNVLNSTGIGSLLPGANRFRLYSVTNSFPSMPTAQYRLSVTGFVATPLNLTYLDLKAMPRVQLAKDFQCVTGWRVPQVAWTGVPLASVLDRAGVQAGATAVLFTSFDGAYTESLTLEQARRPDVIVAYGMLGAEPISSEHGGPVRLYVAPMYGYKSCKWLSSIQVTDRVVPGYWEQQGYDVDAWIGRSNGRSDAPVD